MKISVELSGAQSARISPHLPKRCPISEGGRPRADDRGSMEGILWVMRALEGHADAFPAYATGWRRLGEWERANVLLSVWRAFLADLDAVQQLD